MCPYYTDKCGKKQEIVVDNSTVDANITTSNLTAGDICLYTVISDLVNSTFDVTSEQYVTVDTLLVSVIDIIELVPQNNTGNISTSANVKSSDNSTASSNSTSATSSSSLAQRGGRG
jgi:hypothetical protein